MTFLFKVDLNYSQPYDWGKDDGCDHFSICPKGKEYCPEENKGQNLCTRNHLNKGYCADLSEFMEGCNMVRSLSSTSCLKDLPNEITPDPEEIYGAHSRCFEWRERLTNNQTTFVQCHIAKVKEIIINFLVRRWDDYN